jgi:phage-related minor tail protein
MGEAGPEAVMPLKRLPSGKLGVDGSAAGVIVNIINNTPRRRPGRGSIGR